MKLVHMKFVNTTLQVTIGGISCNEGNKQVGNLLSPQATKHQKYHDQPPSIQNIDGGGNQELNGPTTLDLIRHGQEIVDIEKNMAWTEDSSLAHSLQKQRWTPTITFMGILVLHVGPSMHHIYCHSCP